MTEIITSHWVSVDGYVAGPGGEMDWILPDPEMSDYEIELVQGADGLLLGRGTYEDFAAWWPAVAADASAPADQRRYALELNRLKKVVATRSRTQSLWDETVFLPDLTTQAVHAACNDLGRLVLYGSIGVVETLARHRLIDEFHLLCHPLALGGGTPLFRSPQALRLVRSRTFASGVILNVYAPGD